MHLAILSLISMGDAYLYRNIFVPFKTMQRKQNLIAIALGIQKKIWGNTALFRDNKGSI